jgi:hypothetical protein
MSSFQLRHRRVSFHSIAAVAMLLFAGANCPPAGAADLVEQAHSLSKVPADSAFYSSSLRMKEQWEAFVGSKAYGKLMEIPLLQLGKMQATFYLQQSTEPTIAHVREYFESSAGQDAAAVLKEMVSDEIFTYGGNDVAEWVKFAMEMNSMGSRINIQVKAEAEAEEGEQPDVPAEMIKTIIEKLKSQLSVPTFVTGFRIKDGERAMRALDEVHAQLRNVLDEHQPEIAAKLARDEIGGHEFLTLRLDGSMIPWEQIRSESENFDEEQFQSLKDAISKKTLVVALGVADEFVLLSVGASTDHLEKLGQGATMAGNPAIKRLEKHAGERVVSLAYMSKAFAQSLGSPQQTMDDIANSVEQGLVAGKVDEEDRKTILDDIRSFNLAKFMPEAGETSAIGFLTARGYEGFQYTSGKRPTMDSSKPLSILGHVGGSPLLVIAARSKQNLDDYVELVEWLKRIGGDVEKIAEKKSDPEDWAKYQQVRGRGVELLKRLDKANREQLFPAMADGQSAFVMDVAAKSQQWFDKMPESPKPLPMLEMALVTSVSDAEKLRQGVGALIDVAQDGYKLMQEIEPGELPDLDLPAPVISDISGGGKSYSYPLPKDWGINSLVALNAGLTDSVAAVSFMPQTTERLIREQAASIDTSLPLGKPAAMVAHVEFAKMIESTRPWINYGMDVMTGKIKPKVEKEEGSEEEEEAPRQPPSATMIQMGLIVPQLQQFLDVATALRSATSITYEEDGVWVTHSETHIEDLK